MTPSVTVIILGGGQGKRLFPLTLYRSKPAVPLGGKYRLVDIPISNSINSGLRRIFVLTQFNSTSLHRHIHRTYPYEHFNQTSIELLAAEQTLENRDWFQGTADAVRKHFPHYRVLPGDRVLILSGDHIYRMDYRKVLAFHEERKADLTIATVPVEKKEVNQFGIMRLRADARITDFKEKPSPADNIQNYVIPDAIRKSYELGEKGEHYLASMGVYVFRAEALMDLLKGRETDFGREVIPKAIEQVKSYGFVFNGYWRDIGTIRSYYEASLELTQEKPPFRFFTPDETIFTRPRFLPPTRIYASRLKNVLLSEGCNLKGVTIEDSIIGLRSMVKEGTTIKESVLMGADFYQEEEVERLHPDLGIGKDCLIQNAILDKNVRIGNGVIIRNKKNLQEADGENYCIRDGIVIVARGSRIPEGTEI
jgi:glucose-1-phosphate adenylyltransferase